MELIPCALKKFDSMEEFLKYFNSLDNKNKEYSFAGNDINSNIKKYIIWFDKNSSKSYSELVYVLIENEDEINKSIKFDINEVMN